MVFIGNEVFTKLKTDITTATITSPYEDNVGSFPKITFREIANTINESDSSGECVSANSFEINIFTTGNTKVSTCDTLIKKVDDIMSGFYKMNRDTSQPVDNYIDINIHRHLLRYSCLVTKNKEIYRR